MTNRSCCAGCTFRAAAVRSADPCLGCLPGKAHAAALGALGVAQAFDRAIAKAELAVLAVLLVPRVKRSLPWDLILAGSEDSDPHDDSLPEGI